MTTMHKDQADAVREVRRVLDKLMRLCADLDTQDYDRSVEQLKESMKDLKNKEECLFQANEL